MNRSIRTREDAQFEQEFKEATSVNKDALLDNILTGAPIPAAGKSGGGSGGFSNESAMLPGTSMGATDNSGVFNAMYKTATGIASLHENPELLESAVAEMSTDTPPQVSDQPQYKISSRQLYACQKFPALVSFLGTDQGEKLAATFAEKVNELLVERLAENAKSLSKFAHSCEADKQNIRQFYKGEDNQWVCKVVANGPFRGDEAIYYNEKKDKSYVLRLRDKEYEDVSPDFNIIHEVVNTKAIPPLVEESKDD